MIRQEDELTETRKILISLALAFMMIVMLILSIDIKTVHCTKCGESWTMFACELTEEEENHYICPNCESNRYRIQVVHGNDR